MKIYCLLVLLFITASCAPSLPALPPAPAEVVIQHTPALRIIQTSIQECSLQNAPFPVLVNEYSFDRLNPQIADISMSYVDPIDPSLPAFQVAMDELVVIVHPLNNTPGIAFTELQGILQGFITEWVLINPSFKQNGSSPIAVYAYPAKDELMQVIKTRLNTGKGLLSKAIIVDTPESIVEKVAADPNGIAVIPRSYLADTVREISLDDLDDGLTLIPIIAQTRSEPTESQAIMIHCLQELVKK